MKAILINLIWFENILHYWKNVVLLFENPTNEESGVIFANKNKLYFQGFIRKLFFPGDAKKEKRYLLSTLFRR
jgi:hypothetical protein